MIKYEIIKIFKLLLHKLEKLEKEFSVYSKIKEYFYRIFILTNIYPFTWHIF